MPSDVMKLNGICETIFLQRYATPEETEWDQCARRVARHIASVEINGLAAEWQEKFYSVISAGDFMPGGRILFGAARRQFNMLNCFRLHPQDTVESIGKMVQDTYRISCGGGGIGFNFSDVRPKGDDIQNIRWSAPGTVSVMRMINQIGHHVRSGRNRRTALIAILDVNHPDLFEFLHAKLYLNELNNFNISVGITNEFLNAVRRNKIWDFKFKGRPYYAYDMDRINGKKKEQIRVVALNEKDALGRAQNHYRVTQNDVFDNVVRIDIMAREIWDTIIINAWKSGDPGIYNLDLANSFTNVSYFEDLNSPNPCGEIPLPPYGNCCLGHVNLANMYNDKKNDVDWKKLAATIRTAIRFLDNVLASNHYPISECRTISEISRRIGLGVTGLHHLLLRLGYVYGDEKCLEFLDRFFATFRNEAYKASVLLAQEKGAFSAFDAEKYSNEKFFQQLPPRIQNGIKRHGIRNAVMLTIAPCGTNSMVLGVSSGIEPIFAPVYMRHFREGNILRKEYVADSLFVEYYTQGKDVSHFRGAHEISVEQHIAVQATIQRYIDSSISKTINIQSDYPVEDLGDVVLEYAPYVKGVTIYRNGSRDNEPLTPVDISDCDTLASIMSKIGVETASAEKCQDAKCEI